MGSGEQLKYITPITDKTRNFAEEMNSRYKEIEKMVEQLGNPNLLTNGDFQIWQRGELFAPTSNIYTADRWLVADSQPARVEKVLNTCPESLNKYACKITLANNYNIICQPLENFDELVGKTVTLSFWVKGSAEMGYQLNFGGDGGYFSFNISTQWKKIVMTKKMMASLLTRQRGIGIASGRIDFGGKYIELADVKLEYGEIATTFTPENETLELLKCQKYYVEWNGLIYSAQTTHGYRSSVKYPTRMRIKPTLITEMLGGGTATVTEGMTQDGFTFGSIGNQILTKYYADAEIY